MDILFYAILFIIGSAVGGYWAIKSNELPRSIGLKKTQYSRNPKADLISKLIYIIMGGVSSVVLANIVGLSLEDFDVTKSVIYVFAMMYISTLILVAGIDRNYSKIDKRVIAFGVVSSVVYMIYLFVVDLTSAHLSIIYLIIYTMLLALDSFLLRKFAKDSYIVNLLILLNIILVFTDLRALTYTLAMAIIASGIYALILKIQKKKNGNKKFKIKEIPIGYFIGSSDVIVLFMIRIFENYLI
jgi:hypothetical protein